MTAATGQTLRRLGLLIEVVSMLGLLSARRGDVGLWTTSGLDPSVVLPVIFGLGLILWAVGTETLRRARRREAEGSK